MFLGLVVSQMLHEHHSRPCQVKKPSLRRLTRSNKPVATWLQDGGQNLQPLLECRPGGRGGVGRVNTKGGQG